jgi:hypothetical protein
LQRELMRAATADNDQQEKLPDNIAKIKSGQIPK